MKKQRFCDIRIQIQQILSERLRHDANSFRLALWLAIHRLHKINGTFIVTDEVLAKEFEQSTDTIARTVGKLTDSGLFRIKRGRTGKATEYALVEVVWAQAHSLKQEAKLRSLQVDYAGKFAETNTANLRSSTRQERGPFLKKEKEKKGANSSDEIVWGAFGGLGHHKLNSHVAKQFSDTLNDLGFFLDLQELPFKNGPNGKLYLMPNFGLPRRGSKERLPYQQLLAATLTRLELFKLQDT